MKSNGSLHNTENPQPVDVTRRKFLAASAVGVAGLGAVGSAAAAPDEHTLVIGGTGIYTSYSFTVGGNLQKSTADGAGIDSQDEIVGQSAHGAVTSGKDAYTFTGSLYSFNFDDSGGVDVDLDGEAARIGQRPDHTLLIEGFGPRTTYSFATDGIVTKSDAYGASTSYEDEANAFGAAGAVGGGKDAYTFDGDLQAFEFDQDGALRVTLDGKAAHVGQLPDQMVYLFVEIGYSAGYEINIRDGSIQNVLHADQVDAVTDDMISGSVSDDMYVKFTYNGEIESFTTDNADVLEAYSNYEKLY